MQIHDKRFLKRLAAVASNTASYTPNAEWKEAYMNLHTGAAKLWRLIEQSEVQGQEKFGSDEPPMEPSHP